MSHALVHSGDHPIERAAAADLRLPAPVDKNALRAYLTLLEDPEALQLQNRLAKAYDAACAALIGPNDVQIEGKGDNARSFKKKSAWKKLARYFSISTTVLERNERFVLDESTGESVFVATCTVRAVSPWGQYADSVGACATDEETGKRKITIADAIGTAETRASNRATSNLVAMGEVSAEEATREEREQVVQDAAAELTLEEAKAVKFPWRNPEKYRDKPMGDLSVNMLTSVLDATEKEITKVGATPRRVELKRACELLLTYHATRAEFAEPKATAAPSEPTTESNAAPTDAGAASLVAPSTDREVAPAPAATAPAAAPRFTGPAAFKLPFTWLTTDVGTPIGELGSDELEGVLQWAMKNGKHLELVEAVTQLLDDRRFADAEV